ncbi:MAG TPA: hypothetical protein VGW78_05480 [Candidatus Babeliales bacterium]|jgi:hypothetical protein|nr:hypothetical protein [Candidatus Babeliales bacterium]
MIRIQILFIIFCCISCIYAQDPWINPKDIDVKTMFYQGMFSSQTQAAKYTGSHGFIATTGEHVVCNKAIDVIEDVYIKPEISEVCPLKYCAQPTWFNTAYFTSPITSICGLVSRYANKGYGITVSCCGPDQPTHTIAGHRIYFGSINIGQQGDIDDYIKKYNACQKEYPNAVNVSFNVSRGSGTAFCAYALNYALMDKVKLMILEGCFDSIPNVFKYRYPWIPNTIKQFVYRLVSRFTSHKPEGISPISVVDQFPHHTPVAFITSEIDTEVPAVCTKNLAQTLANTGHPAVYLLVLKHSSHPRYMMDNKEDRNNYQNFIHAYYKKYDFPYISTYADAGAALLSECLLNKNNM